MGIVPSELNETTKFGVGTMGQDEDEDGLELQIQQLVEKFTKAQDEKVALKMQEQNEDMERRMAAELLKQGDVARVKIEELSAYTAQVHS